jgi:hypothetical protein
MEGSLALIDGLFDQPSREPLTYINGLDLKKARHPLARDRPSRPPQAGLAVTLKTQFLAMTGGGSSA